jgi:hypothetical protein
MSSINDIAKYKKAVLLTKEIRETLVILDEAEKKLVKYSKYLPILSCLNAIQDAKLVLKTHYAQQDRVVRNKGKVD